MPQFDFSTYNPQIFWFTLCFAVLYLSVSFMILPRIRNIITAREGVVASDKSASKKLEEQINDLQNKTEKLQHESSDAYEEKLEEISRKVAKDRERALTNLKNDLDERAKKSRAEFKLLLITAEAQALTAVQTLVQNIRTKIL